MERAAQLQSRVTQLEHALADAQTQGDAARESLARVKDELAKATDRASKNEQRVAFLTRERDNLQAFADVFTNDVKGNTSLTGLKEQNDKLQAALTKMEKDLAGAQQQVLQLQGVIDTQQRELEQGRVREKKSDDERQQQELADREKVCRAVF